MQHLGQRHRLLAYPALCTIPIRRRKTSRCVQKVISYSSRGPAVEKSNFFKVCFGAGAAVAALGTAVVWIYGTTRDESSKIACDPETFTPFTLISREAASPTSSVFTLKPTFSGECSKIYLDAWKKGVWSVQVKQPQLQIARSYTPLPPIQVAEESGNLRLLIRLEPRGEVSTYLHNLHLGATVELRGPHIEYGVPDDTDEVLFIAGGTGVAPALQVAYNLFENRQSAGSTPRLRILWANRQRGDSLGGKSDTPLTVSNNLRHWSNVVYSTERTVKSQGYSKLPRSALVQELEALKEKNKGKLSVDYFCDEEHSYITKDVLKQYLAEPKTSKARLAQNASIGKRLILISGPEGFVNYHAGPKKWFGGEELQGSLGGILKELDPRDWIIWKL